MNGSYQNAQAFGELFVDAAREAVERSRIKSQMCRLAKVIETDKARIRNNYAEIGRMYCEGTLETEPQKYDKCRANIEKIEQRIERAKLRYELLKEAHSVDECTEAFRAELKSKVDAAKAKTTEKARDITDKAKVVAKDITDKAKDVAAPYADKAADAFADVKRKVAEVATDAADKAKVVVDNITSKASETVEIIKNGGIDGEDLVYTPEDEAEDYTEDTAETSEETSEAEDMLKRISETLESVDNASEESAESFDF